jgi:uncharacterized LabA/DUF88 family protein
MAKKIYLFVDGAALRGYLENVARRYFPGETFEVDLGVLADSGSYEKTFWYDAIPVRGADEELAKWEAKVQAKQDFLRRIKLVPGVHVFEGDARQRKKRGLEQKMVDIALAVDVLTHAFRRNMDQVAILTGDQDFVPLFGALLLEGMFVHLLYPIGETNEELLVAADGRWPIRLQQLRTWLTPESRGRFAIAGATVSRPSWVSVAGDDIANWDENTFFQRTIWRERVAEPRWVVENVINNSNTRFYSHKVPELAIHAARTDEQYPVAIPADAYAAVEKALGRPLDLLDPRL